MSADIIYYFAADPWVCTGTLRVSDPYVGAQPWEGCARFPALSGEWACCTIQEVESECLQALLSWSRASSMPDEDCKWRELGPVSTISKHCGIFDDSRFPAKSADAEVSEIEEQRAFAEADLFADRVCDVADSAEHGFDVVRAETGSPVSATDSKPLGVVSLCDQRSGTYRLRVRYAAGGAVDAVRVDFVDIGASSDREGAEILATATTVHGKACQKCLLLNKIERVLTPAA